jgi:hypothetical protein
MLGTVGAAKLSTRRGIVLHLRGTNSMIEVMIVGLIVNLSVLVMTGTAINAFPDDGR